MHETEAQETPSLTFKSTSNSTYIAICLDLDAPVPSFSILGPVLHWCQPGLKPDVSGSGTLTSSEPFVANYAGPGPPPGSSPHRYVFLLYEQPAGFEVSKYAPAGGKGMGIRGRMRYDLGVFEREAGLGEVVAVNYFRSK